MKYVSPKYEISLLEACDVIMSGEVNYTVEKSEDENGTVIGDVTISAGSIFGRYFN